MSAAPPAVPQSRSPLEKVLGLVADVRPGEAEVALLLTLNLFLVLFGYYILKTIRESLILTRGGSGREDLHLRGPGPAAPQSSYQRSGSWRPGSTG